MKSRAPRPQRWRRFAIPLGEFGRARRPTSAALRLLAPLLLGSFRQLKLKLDLQTRRVVQQFDIGIVETRNSGNQAEAQPISGSASISFESVKSPENVPMLLIGNARTVIGD